MADQRSLIDNEYDFIGAYGDESTLVWDRNEAVDLPNNDSNLEFSTTVNNGNDPMNYYQPKTPQGAIPKNFPQQPKIPPRKPSNGNALSDLEMPDWGISSAPPPSLPPPKLPNHIVPTPAPRLSISNYTPPESNDPFTCPSWDLEPPNDPFKSDLESSKSQDNFRDDLGNGDFQDPFKDSFTPPILPQVRIKKEEEPDFDPLNSPEFNPFQDRADYLPMQRRDKPLIYLDPFTGLSELAATSKSAERLNEHPQIWPGLEEQVGAGQLSRSTGGFELEFPEGSPPPPPAGQTISLNEESEEEDSCAATAAVADGGVSRGKCTENIYSEDPGVKKPEDTNSSRAQSLARQHVNATGYVALEDVYDRDWFSMALTNKEAEELLMRHKKDGSFLVRNNRNRDGLNFAITFYSKKIPTFVKHINIRYIPERHQWVLGKLDKPNMLKFERVSSLVNYYVKHGFILDNGVTIKLTTPITKKKKLPFNILK